MKAFIQFKSAAHGIELSHVLPGFMPLKTAAELSHVFPGLMPLKKAQKICAIYPNHIFVKCS